MCPWFLKSCRLEHPMTWSEALNHVYSINVTWSLKGGSIFQSSRGLNCAYFVRHFRLWFGDLGRVLPSMRRLGTSGYGHRSSNNKTAAWRLACITPSRRYKGRFGKLKAHSTTCPLLIDRKRSDWSGDQSCIIHLDMGHMHANVHANRVRVF